MDAGWRRRWSAPKRRRPGRRLITRHWRKTSTLEREVGSGPARSLLRLDRRVDVPAIEEWQPPGEDRWVGFRGCEIAEGIEAWIGRNHLVGIGDAERGRACDAVRSLQGSRETFSSRRTVEARLRSGAQRVEIGVDEEQARAAVDVARGVVLTAKERDDVTQVQVRRKHLGAAQSVVGLGPDAEDER